MFGAKKIIECPHCRAGMRVPVKTGKTLRVHCPRCNSSFEIAFTNPLSGLFQWNPSLPFTSNLKQIAGRISQLPPRVKLTLLLMVFSIAFLLSSVVNLIRNSDSDAAPSAVESPQDDSPPAEEETPEGDLLKI